MLIGQRASAGAGKTFALATRYISLLSTLKEQSPEELRSIVAITFTNKAAAEMRERILRFLKEIAFKTDYYKKNLKDKIKLDPSDAGSWIETIISNYSDFQVRTIDSLLVAILKGLSFEIGLKPEMKVLFSEKEVYGEAFETLLSEENLGDLWKGVLENFLFYDERPGFYPEKRLKKRIVEEIYPKVRGQSVESPYMRADVQKEIDNALGRVTDAYKKLADFRSQHSNKVNKRIFSIKENPDANFFKELCTGQRNLENGSPDNLLKKDFVNTLSSSLAPLLESYQQAIRDFCKAITKMPYVKLIGYIKLLKRMKDTVQDISSKEGMILGSRHWTDLILSEIKNEGVPPLVYAHFATKFKHFLLDEFQDTSRDQWEALKPIFEDIFAYNGNSMFLVGDSKQAIYGWRGGDWKLYEMALNGNEFPSLDESRVREETLECNYRSHPDLVEFYNELFSMFSQRDVVENLADACLGEELSGKVKEEFVKNITGVFKKSEQTPARGQQGNNNTNNHEPRLSIVKIGDSDTPKDNVLEKTREMLVERVSAEWKLWDRLSGQGTPIAVLLRKNSTVEEVSSLLLHAGIPVVTDSALKIEMSSVVKGLLSLLHLINEPDEMVYEYGFLASGLFKDAPSDESALVRTWMDAEEKDKLRKKVADFVRTIRGKLPELDPYQLLWMAIVKLEINKRLDSDLKAHKPFMDRLLEVTHRYVCEEGTDLTGFLEFMEGGGSEARVGLPENVRAVRVMNVHKSKGLEFPVVFVPLMDWGRVRDDLVDVVEKNGKSCLVYMSKPLDDFLKEYKDEKKAREFQEMLHLFYVALTRSREKLHIIIPMYKNNSQEILIKAVDSPLKDIADKFSKEKIKYETISATEGY